MKLKLQDECMLIKASYNWAFDVNFMATPSSNKDKMKWLFVTYQSLYVQYKERADSYRAMVGRDVLVYSDCVARLAKSKADYYERMLTYG